MKRIRTKYEYHDAELVRVQWVADDELVLDFDLCFDGIVVSVRFQRVGNREEVERQLCSIASRMTHERYLADVVGIWREDDRTFLLDTSQGAVTIIASNMLE